MMEKSQKNQKQKNLSKDTQRGLFHYRVKFPLCKGKPQTPKAKAKAKMALASLVSSQKQKRTIVKIFSKSDTKKRFSEGNNRTFIVSLVDTR